MESKSNSGFVFGLDIGIASVGWAVLAPDHIVALGVRAFNRAETPKTGEALNLTRRNARLVRNRLHRRATRLKRLATFLKERGLITDVASFHQRTPLQSPWHLRVAGLDRQLAPEEWARVLYHLAKHRGFHWSGLDEEGADAGEAGRIRKALNRSEQTLQAKEKGYRTAAEMILGEFPDAQRNKQGDYQKALSRRSLGRELSWLFERQRALGNPHAGPDMEQEMLGENNDAGYFWEQRPPLTGEDLLRMLGQCTLEKNEFRAPRHSFSAERHMWLTRLNNLRVFVDGQPRPLNNEERSVVIRLPYEKTSVSYTHIREELQKAGLVGEEFWFAGLTSRGDKNPETTAFCKLTAWHEIRKRLHKEKLRKEWNAISAPALEKGQSDMLDKVATILSVYKEEEEIKRKLSELPLPNPESVIPVLARIRFNKFSNLSLVALRKILRHMEHGQRYDEACENAGYNHAQPRPHQKTRYLPPLYSDRNSKGGMVRNPNIADIPRNPVVLRAINQAHKVVNALVKKYGAPTSVHVELARDLSNSFAKRKEIEKGQETYRKTNEQARKCFGELFGRPPREQELSKFLLYREQGGKCAYSLRPITLNRILEPNYVQIDHILPYSRSQDNSRNNHALVFGQENQNKGNKTPYEYLGGETESPRWQKFVGFVSTIQSKAKRSRLLRQNFGRDESQKFKERHLNDTRYICRFVKNFLEQHLQLATEKESTRCVVVSGRLTGFLRARWGLHKNREKSDRHHALDAAVVAACDHALIKRIADYHKLKELSMVPDDFIDPETGEVSIRPRPKKEQFPAPWEKFHEEVLLRTEENDMSILRNELARLGVYTEEELQHIKPLFVSRAPQRRNEGAAHKETIYAKWPDGKVIEKVALSSLKKADLDEKGQIIGLVDRHRNEKLYAAIEKRLRDHGGNAVAAFQTNMYKPSRNGRGPLVRSIKREVKKLTGIPVRGGIAKNDTMLRIDVFRKSGEHFMIPVYMHHKGGHLPTRAIVSGKDESEWTEILPTDSSYEFLFSAYPNDFLRIVSKNGTREGYYEKCNRSNASINLWLHDHSHKIESIGVKTVMSIAKYHVDVLGNIYTAPAEVRRELA